MVKPEHTQPERGSFFITEGRIFPAGTIQGDGANFDPNQRGTSACGSAEARFWWRPMRFLRRRFRSIRRAVRPRKAGQRAAFDRGRGG